jgi:hypothetical protein
LTALAKLAVERSGRLVLPLTVATKVLVISSLAWILSAQEPVQPAPPQKTVDLSMPFQGTSTCPSLTTGSNCRRNVPAGDAKSFQSALKAATCGDTIVLMSGSIYSGNFTVPATTCTNNSGWIEIISSELPALPEPGNRVTPAEESKMPIISTPNVASALSFLPGANHWRVIGCKITTSYVSTNTLYWLVGMGLDQTGKWVTDTSQLPSYIILDRTYLYGSTTTPIQRAVYANTQSFAMVDSYCDEIVDSGADSQCIGVVNGIGPFLIQNNFLQASGENIMFGGADPITNLIPSDITIVGNLFQKNITWRGKVGDVKNLLELKNAQRLLVDGNVFQYDWSAGQSWPILFRSINQSGKCTWCVVQDVTFTHNLLLHIPDGIEVAATDSTLLPAQPTARILVRNNLLTDVSTANWGPSQGASFFAASNATYAIHDIIFDHNTAFSDGKAFLMGDSGHVANLQFTNNLLSYGSYGILGSGVAAGTAVFDTYASGYVYSQNLIINSTGKSIGVYPPGTIWTTLSAVKFTEITGTPPNYTGDFQLMSDSLYHNAGTDGKDIGVWDWDCLNKDIVAAQAGTFVGGADGCGATSIPATATEQKPTVQAPTNLNVIVH